MPYFSKTSKAKLKTCHADLRILFKYVIEDFDCTIVCGHREKEKQDKAYGRGHSQVRWPNSKHNRKPSMATDAVPYPIEWSNVNRMRLFAGFVLGIAKMLKKHGIMEHDVRAGLDWDKDFILKDNRFNDFPHFELIPDNTKEV